MIIESAAIKTEAFSRVFSDYPDHLEEIVQHHLDNVSLSRFEKFKIYHQDYLGIDLDDQQVQELANKFHDLVVRKVIDAPFVMGSLEFLKKYYKYVPLYIISATPKSEINEIIDKKGLRKYFKGVYGSPTNKNEWAKSIISNNNFDPKNVIFVGDALSDYNAAIDCGLHFVARIEKSGSNPFEGKKVVSKISDLFDLEVLIHANK